MKTQSEFNWTLLLTVLSFMFACGFLYAFCYEVHLWEEIDPWYEIPTKIITVIMLVVFCTMTYGGLKIISGED